MDEGERDETGGEQERTKRGDEADEVKGMFMPGEDDFGEGG